MEHLCRYWVSCIQSTDHLTEETETEEEEGAEVLWNIVESCWDNMSQQVLHNLLESLAAPVHAVIKAKRGTTQMSLIDYF